MEIKILHAEVQTLSRIRFKEILLKKQSLISYQEALHSKHLFEQIESSLPHVLIINYNEGVNFSETDIFKVRIDYPEIKILVVSSDNLSSRIKAVMQSGVAGYIFSDAEEIEIVNAVFSVVRGEKVISDKVVEALINEPNLSKKEWLKEKGISQRESEIIKLLALGSTNKQIADQLGLSHHTVHTHRRNIMKKLNIRTISELTLFAVKTRLIESNNY